VTSDARFTVGRLRQVKNTQISVTIENRTHTDSNFFYHKDLENHAEFTHQQMHFFILKNT